MPKRLAEALLGDHTFLALFNKRLKDFRVKAQPMFERSIVYVEVSKNVYNHKSVSQSPTGVGSSGSGFTVGYKGYHFIVTNAHVVKESYHEIVRKMYDETQYEAKVLLRDYDTDIALLAVEDPKFWQGVTLLEFNQIFKMRQNVVVVGFPLGGTEVCATQGFVSRVEVRAVVTAHTQILQVQITAIGNPGNSGGAALNSDGEVIGVLFQGITSASRLAYIIPAEYVVHVLDDYIRSVESCTPYRGFPDLEFCYQPLDGTLSRNALGLEESYQGVLIKQVAPLCTANGIMLPGDILLAMDGKAVSSDGMVTTDFSERVELTYLIQRKHMGDTISAILKRGSQILDVTIPLRHRARTAQLLGPYKFDRPPTFFCVCGIVLTPITQQVHDKSLVKWHLDTAAGDYKDIGEHNKSTVGQELVVIIGRFASKDTRDFRCVYEIVTHVNGVKINNLRHAISIIEANNGEYHYLRTHEQDTLALKNLSVQAHQKILKRNGLLIDRSDDLLSPPEYEPGSPEYEAEQKANTSACKPRPSRN